MNPNGHERYEDELAAYMLGALEAGELPAFEAHLASCRRCQEREKWLRASVDVLPAAVAQLEPPPALRDRLMDAVWEEAGASQDATRPRPSARPPRGLRAWLGSLALRPATALAATVLILAAGIVGYAIGNGASGTTKIAATGTAAAPQTTGTLVRNGDRGVLRVANLPQRRGRIYEVWLVQKGKPVASTLFQVARDGAGAAGIPDGLDDSTQVMVTSEPPGGSLQPTTQPLLSARI